MPGSCSTSDLRAPGEARGGHSRGGHRGVLARRAAAAIALGAAVIAPAAVEATAPPVVLVYSEQDGETHITHTFVIEPTSAGYAIELTSRGGGADIHQRFQTCPAFSVLSWLYRDPAAGTDISAVREETAILLSGRHKGVEIARTLRINAWPWYQLFPHGLERQALAAEKPVRFWAVGVEGIGAMRVGSFRATVTGVEQVEWQNRAVQAIHMRISLAGPASILWRGDYWYRSGDGRNLISSSDRGPGTRPIRVELTAER